MPKFSPGWLLLSPEKRAIQTCDGDRDQFNRDQHAADDGVGCGRREDEVHPKKFRGLAWGSFPWRKHHRDDQPRDHSIQHIEIQLFWLVGIRPTGCGRRTAGLKPLSAIRAEA